MRSFWSVAFAVAWRVLHNVFTTPSLLFPSLVFPLFFFTAFAGGFSRVDNIPGFDFPLGYTAFQFVFVLLQSAAFGGRSSASVCAGLRVRLRAAPHGCRAERKGIIAGYAIAALGRWLLTAAILTVVALIAGWKSVATESTCSRSTASR